MTGKMHAIKHQARNIAWRYGDDEYVNYNPFAKRSRSYVRNKSPHDEESGLRKTNTADDDQTAERQARFLEMHGVDHEDHIHHSSTDPTKNTSYAATSNPSTAMTESPPSDLPGVEEKERERGLARSSSQETGQTGPRGRSIPGSLFSTQQGSLPRKRFMGLIGHEHVESAEESDADMQRTDTNETKKLRPKIKIWDQFKTVMFGSWVNVLLVCVPIGFAVRYANLQGNAKISIFVVNFIAIVPLAAMLSFATEELALYVGETLGGLLNASFGNATELIVGVIALAQSKIVIVQTSLIGSMLSNLLLVLGMCFFFGGINRVTQHFNITVAQTASSMLALAIGSLIVPTAFDAFGTGDASIPSVSHGVAVILLFVYAAYLVFQLHTHVAIYNAPSQKSEKIKGSKKEKGDVLRGLATMGAGSAAAAGGHVNQSNLVHQDEEEEETPSLTIAGALVTLTIATVLIAFCSEFMVTGIDYITETGKISEEFVGLILVPIVGNAAEHATAVTVAIKDKMDLAIGVAVGSSMQIALLVLPLMVVISWCGVGNEAMTLDFDGFQVAVLFIAILLVNYLIQDGESHWLEGTLLMCLYVIIATTAWFYPVTGAVS
ncbi:Sodium/calcium exchanger protein-domain-containing protein [Delphinella strobiligena]|nr:Sodium/calcium exchanger protein-domain-containing protein [Delphinella strobiligena]